jgi:hypothetical protein
MNSTSNKAPNAAVTPAACMAQDEGTFIQHSRILMGVCEKNKKENQIYTRTTHGFHKIQINHWRKKTTACGRENLHTPSKTSER